MRDGLILRLTFGLDLTRHIGKTLSTCSAPIIALSHIFFNPERIVFI